MSTLSVPRIHSSPAYTWFEQHLPELTSRAAVFARRFPLSQRDDAVAEIIAQTWRYVLSAAARGKLVLLTPFTLISYFGRSFAAGRRLCSTRGSDILSPVAQQRHGPRVLSLDQPRWVHTPEGPACQPLSEVLAHRRAPNPLEAARQNLDYAGILRRRKAGRKSRQVFAILAQSHGTAQGVEIARALRVSPPRVVQLKHQLAQCLAAEDYGPPPTRPDGRTRRKRGRPRRFSPPLNAGTSPAAGPTRQDWAAWRRLRVTRDVRTARRPVAWEGSAHV